MKTRCSRTDWERVKREATAGAGWQTRVNAALRQWLQEHPGEAT